RAFHGAHEFQRPQAFSEKRIEKGFTILYYDTWYRPDLEAVVVVGDIDVGDAEKQIIRHFRNHHEGQMKTNEYWLASLSHSWIDQEDPSWMNDFYKTVEGLSARDLRETARKYLNTSNYIQVQLLPE